MAKQTWMVLTRSASRLEGALQRMVSIKRRRWSVHRLCICAVQIPLSNISAHAATPAQYAVGAAVLSSYGACIREQSVTVASAGVAAVNGVYQLTNRNGAHYWVHSNFPYYVLIGDTDNEQGLVDMFRYRWANEWRIRKDGIDLYKTTSASIQGPWTAISISNLPAPSSWTVWPCPSNLNNNYGSHYMCALPPPNSSLSTPHTNTRTNTLTGKQARTRAYARTISVHTLPSPCQPPSPELTCLSMYEQAEQGAYMQKSLRSAVCPVE